MVVFAATFSAMLALLRERLVGPSFTSVMLMVNGCSKNSPPWSVVRTRIA